MAITSAGTSAALSLNAPAAQDEAGYTALTYTELGGVESIAAFGPTSAVNSYQPLAGPVEKHKGPPNYGSLQIPVAIDKADAGQALIRLLADPANNDLGTFRVRYPNGDKRYFRGRVFGAPETPGSATNLLMMTPIIEINTAIVKADLIALFGTSRLSWGGAAPLFGD